MPSRWTTKVAGRKLWLASTSSVLDTKPASSVVMPRRLLSARRLRLGPLGAAGPYTAESRRSRTNGTKVDRSSTARLTPVVRALTP